MLEKSRVDSMNCSRMLSLHGVKVCSWQAASLEARIKHVIRQHLPQHGERMVIQSEKKERGAHRLARSYALERSYDMRLDTVSSRATPSTNGLQFALSWMFGTRRPDRKRKFNAVWGDLKASGVFFGRKQSCNVSAQHNPGGGSR